MTGTTLSLEALNALPATSFVAALGKAFEQADLVAHLRVTMQGRQHSRDVRAAMQRENPELPIPHPISIDYTTYSVDVLEVFKGDQHAVVGASIDVEQFARSAVALDVGSDYVAFIRRNPLLELLEISQFSLFRLDTGVVIPMSPHARQIPVGRELSGMPRAALLERLRAMRGAP